MTISIIIPTRKRFPLLTNTMNSLTSKAKQPEAIEFCLRIDSDDTETIEQVAELSVKDKRIKYTVGPRIIQSEMINEAYRISTGQIIWLFADDVIVLTDQWDAYIEFYSQEFDDGIVLLWPDDGMNKELATHPIITRKWVEIIGELVPSVFAKNYSDTHLNDIANLINRRIKIPVHIKHYHLENMDDTMKESLQKLATGEPVRCYNSLSGHRVDSARKLYRHILRDNRKSA